MTKSPLKLVNTRQRPSVKEDGTLMHSQPVPMYLDSRGDPEFVFKVPEFIQRALDVHNEVRKPTADEAEACWKETVQWYHEHLKLAKAEPVIVVFLHYSGNDTEGRCIQGKDAFFDNRLRATRAGLAFELAFRVNDKVHHRVRRTDYEFPDAPFGERGKETVVEVPGYVMHDANLDEDGVVVMDYTTELHAQLEAIEASINRAAQALHEIGTSRAPQLLIARMAQRALPAPTNDEVGA